MYSENFLESEINNFSTELKVCFYLLGWNKNFKINSVKDWIDNFYIYYQDDDSITEIMARRNMLEEYARMYDFVTKYFK